MYYLQYFKIHNRSVVSYLKCIYHASLTIPSYKSSYLHKWRWRSSLPMLKSYIPNIEMLQFQIIYLKWLHTQMYEIGSESIFPYYKRIKKYVKIIRHQEIKNSILFTDAYHMTFTFVQQKECTNRLLYRIEVHQLRRTDF